VKQRKPMKTWERTRLQNLIRHKSGRYYARAFSGGKEVWKSLKTSHFSVAEARLAQFLKEHRERRSNGNGEVAAKMTFGEAAAIHLHNLDDSPTNYNNTAALLRHVLNVAIEAGVIYSNPAVGLKRAAIRGKEMASPLGLPRAPLSLI
jgi:hypothetical protein